jgi:hypothetical protein
LQSAISVIGLECGWASPFVLGKMFVDDFDLKGIYWWANKINEQNEKIKGNKKNGS